MENEEKKTLKERFTTFVSEHKTLCAVTAFTLALAGGKAVGVHQMKDYNNKKLKAVESELEKYKEKDNIAYKDGMIDGMFKVLDHDKSL